MASDAMFLEHKRSPELHKEDRLSTGLATTWATEDKPSTRAITDMIFSDIPSRESIMVY